MASGGAIEFTRVPRPTDSKKSLFLYLEHPRTAIEVTLCEWNDLLAVIVVEVFRN